MLKVLRINAYDTTIRLTRTDVPYFRSGAGLL